MFRVLLESVLFVMAWCSRSISCSCHKYKSIIRKAEILVYHGTLNDYSQWYNWNFSLTESFRPHYGLELTQPLAHPLTEMSTRDISGGKDGRFVGLTTLPTSCADCLDIWEPQTPEILGLLRPVIGLLFTLNYSLNLLSREGW